MFRRVGCLVMMAAASLAYGSRVQAQEPLPDEAQKSAATVKTHLQKLKGDHAQLIYKDDTLLKKMFPEHQFIVARYRQFPVAKVLPEGLRASNIFAITTKDQQLQHVKDVKALESFFKTNQAPAGDEAAAKASLRCWLILAQEFPQDGLYKFEVLDKEFGSEGDDKSRTVRGRALVTQGGKGELGATLVYADGKLTKAIETKKIMPGPRPICQATKLLDRDAIVRKMAEQDLLFMGLAARDYLMEQRAQASPELGEAIDRLWRKIRANGW